MRHAVLVLLTVVVLLAVGAQSTPEHEWRWRGAQAQEGSEAARAAQAGPLSDALAAHTMNATLSGATGGWPTTQVGLSATDAVVTETVCALLPSTVAACGAFFLLVDTAVLALQVSVQTTNVGDGNVVYNTLSSWADNTGSVPYEAIRVAVQTLLGVSVSPLTYNEGTYIMPCRGTSVYSFLPACAPHQYPTTVFYVDSASGDVAANLRLSLCGTQTTCAVSITVEAPSLLKPYTSVTMANASSGLEAMLAYVADVRAAFAATQGSIPPSNGNPSAGVSAKRVWMEEGGMTAILFSTTENERYEETYKVTLKCAGSTGYWAFALIAIAPLAAFLFRYVWYKGRHSAKKYNRRLIVEDERRMLEGYAPPAAADEMGMLAAPQQQWVVDEYGNYYDATTGAPYDDGAADLQGLADGESGEYYYEGGDVDGGNGNAVAEAGANVGAQGGEYYSYVDEATGEVYQYVAPTEDVAGTTAAEQDTAGEAGMEGVEAVADQYVENTGGDEYVDPNSVQLYLDPATGETYQYTLENESPQV